MIIIYLVQKSISTALTINGINVNIKCVNGKEYNCEDIQAKKQSVAKRQMPAAFPMSKKIIIFNYRRLRFPTSFYY